ncbi:MAG: exodeoxyribonuclease VII large subunit [Candidatus Moraniibacteriota bacterium]|nr:MAG: exodeoxyribonuclease VII large subunit [Candidatus Moranbacteria bacterium]
MTLMQKLISWQQDQARKEHLEPYMVLQFNTIKEIVRIEPKTHDELLRIKGIGPAKVRKYGDDILHIVRGNGVVGGEAQSSMDLFSEAEVVNDIALSSQNPKGAEVQFNPETGEVIEDKKDDSITVTEFVTMLDTMLRTNFRRVRVQGEVVGFKQNANGHAYFQIKDKDSVLRCTVFRSNYELSGIQLEDGMEIIITGQPSYHKQYGFGFMGNTLELYGEGALKKAYDDLKKKLSEEGLFSSEKKRVLLQLPEKIGLITSRTGAAIGDFTSNVGQYGYKIIFHHTSVEGAYALRDIKSALEEMAKKDIDVLVLVRGGGSLESLQAFNNETIIRMITDFPVPVIVGVGHDEDETLATLVADVGASTPTGAARSVRESWDACDKRVQNYESIIINTFDKVLQQQKHVIAHIERNIFAQFTTLTEHFSQVFHRFFLSVQKIDTHIQSQKVHIQQSQEKIHQHFQYSLDNVKRAFDITYFIKSVATRITYIKEKLYTYEKTLTHNDPQRQLALGYSIARNVKGNVIRKKDDIIKDDVLFVQVSDGEILTKVSK